MTASPDSPLPVLGRHGRVLTWAVPDGWRALSSAAVGGGLVRPRWVLNAGVDDDFARTDLEAWAAEVAGGLGLAGSGCAMLTAADVSRVEHAHRDGVSAWATVGVTKPTWPHDPRAAQPHACAELSCHNGRQDDHRDTTELHDDHAAPAPGTVNIVVAVPVPLTDSALVQAVGTATEAKAQVLVRSGVPGTGTASDAIVVLCPEPADETDRPDGTRSRSGAQSRSGTRRPSGEADRALAMVPFAGVRSTWGRRVAHAVHDAVLAGLVAHPWRGRSDGEGKVW